MVLLDGFKQLYLSMLKMLTPGLRQGAVVLADKLLTLRWALAPCVAYVQDPLNGFLAARSRTSETAWSTRYGCSPLCRLGGL